MGDVIEFRRPNPPQLDLEQTIAAGILDTLRVLGVDRLDIAELVASKCIHGIDEVDALFSMDIEYTLGEMPAAYKEDALRAIGSVVEQVRIHYAKVNRVALRTVGKVAHEATCLTAGKMLGLT